MAIIAEEEVRDIIDNLRSVLEFKKRIEVQAEELRQRLYNAIGEADEVITLDGEILATWKYTNDSQYFDAKRFETEEPLLYNEYLATRAGTRRLVIK